MLKRRHGEMLIFLASIHALSTLFFFFLNEYTCFLGCLCWSPSVRMAWFLLSIGIRPSLEGTGSRQRRVFKLSRRSPRGRFSPVSVLAPPASFHINTPVDTITTLHQRPEGPSRLGEQGTGFGGCC